MILSIYINIYILHEKDTCYHPCCFKDVKIASDEPGLWDEIYKDLPMVSLFVTPLFSQEHDDPNPKIFFLKDLGPAFFTRP